MMAANADLIVSFYRVNSDTVFERYRSRIPRNVLIQYMFSKSTLWLKFLGLKELTIKYGLGDFDIDQFQDFGREK